VSDRRRGPLVVGLGLKWPPEDYLGRRLEGLAERGLRIAVAADADHCDERASLRGVELIRLPRWGEPGVVSLLGALRDGLRLGVRRPGTLWRLMRATGGAGTGRAAWLDAVRRLRFHLPVVLARPDVIHVEWESAAVGLLPLLEAVGCPVLVSSHGGILLRPRAGDQRLTAAYPDLLARASAVHCVCEAVREEAERFGLQRRRAHVIPTAVDAGYFTPNERADADSASLRVVGVGELHWVKGYDDALKAVAMLAAEGVDVSYEILGGDPLPGSGRVSDRSRLLHMVEDLGLERRVRLLGGVSQETVRERLRAADVLLQASLSEGLPNTVLEAMACALPVVVTDCGGLREAVDHGVEGLVCPRRAPRKLGYALRAMLDRPRASAMGEAGRARVCREFPLARQLESFDRLYEDLANAG
jgi:colanic acid/amylovoran biosynthesis glycosyltransferase